VCAVASALRARCSRDVDHDELAGCGVRQKYILEFPRLKTYYSAAVDVLGGKKKTTILFAIL